MSLRYDLGGGHPLIGRSTPDFAWRDGTTISSLLHGGKGLLLNIDANPSLRASANHWPACIDYVAGEPQDRLGLHPVLVQPDGIVAWASDTAFDEEAITRIMVRWFGG